MQGSGATLNSLNDVFSATGTLAGGAEMFTRANAGPRIAYTTLNGASALVSTGKVVSTLKVAGNATFVGGVLIDATLSATGQQSWGKTLVNTAVGGAAIAIGGVPGLIVGTGYLILDKTGCLDGPSGPMNYTPPSIAMPDATRVVTPMLRYP